MAMLKIRTPTKNVSITKAQAVKGVDNSVFAEELKLRTSKLALENLAKSTKIAIDRQISVMATFFQRVVARTPLDEDYTYNYLKADGTITPKKHMKDRVVCQDDWYITDGKIKITAKQLKTIDERMFLNVNDKYFIDQIKKVFKEKFKIDESTTFTVGNDNPHFELLENGNERWKKRDTLKATKKYGKKESEKVLREHGVKNWHSVQAPVGMWRISLAELELMLKSDAKSPITSRYRAQTWRVMNTMPNKRKLAEFARLLESKGNLKYKDIARYLENY